MPSPARKRLFRKLMPYFIVWTAGGFIYLLLEYGILGESAIYPSTNNPYDPLASLKSMPFMVVALALSIGLMEELYFKHALKERPFVLRLFLKTLIYVSSIGLIIMIATTIVNGAILGKGTFHPETISAQLTFFFDVSFLSIMVYCSWCIAICIFISEMIDYLGLNVVGHFFTGKYAHPVVEERIFMFLDMKGSTTLAEKLGHTIYYKLVNRYYRDMTKAITQTGAEIYQYVGDEIVLSWTLTEGLRKSNCIRCFFEIEQSIRENSDFYEREFGIVPSFKAGVHVGKVTRGQIGVIKKEMLFTGDTLNTTARIQGLCNELDTRLLISENVRSLLSEASITVNSKGDFQLRGRNQTIQLYEVVTFTD